MLPVNAGRYDEIIQVWEASVRATHHFLKEEDLLFYKKAIREDYLPSGELQLYCLNDATGAIAGFIALSEELIEMLFIRPDVRGQGIGKQLLRYATHDLGKSKVDVNEQNEQAAAFYIHSGFRVAGRSPVDGSGKPYPILHLSL